MQGNFRRLAPYSSNLAQRLALHDMPTNDVYMFIGYNAWQKSAAFADRQNGIICLPFNESPFDYTYPVSGCDVLLFDTGQCLQRYIEDVVICLFAHDANIVRYISPNGLLTVFKKDF